MRGARGEQHFVAADLFAPHARLGDEQEPQVVDSKVVNRIADSNVVADSKDKVVSKADNKTVDNKVVVSKAAVNRIAVSNVVVDSRAVSRTADNNVVADNKVRVIVTNPVRITRIVTRVSKAISNDPIIQMPDKKQISPDNFYH